MKKSLILVVLLFSFNGIIAQSRTFKNEAAQITFKIDSITVAEKGALKKAIKAIDKRLKENKITSEIATSEKKKIAAYHAKRINEAVSMQEQKLQALIKNRVSGNLQPDDSKSNTFFSAFTDENFYKDSITGLQLEKRLTTQFVLALGANMVLNDDGGFYGDGFKTSPFGYGEFGLAFKYRLQEKSNLWNLKFGVSMMANELRAKNDNDIFIKNNNQTTLADSGLDIRRSRLTNLYVGLPVHLELDFSKPQYNKKTDQTYLRSQRGFRLGLGGFFAVRVATNQFIRYNDDDGKRIRLFEEDNFNVNNINFGPSAYIGYRDLSLYVKYDVNSVFRNNPQEVNTLAIGLRADFN